MHDESHRVFESRTQTHVVKEIKDCYRCSVGHIGLKYCHSKLRNSELVCLIQYFLDWPVLMLGACSMRLPIFDKKFEVLQFLKFENILYQFQINS